MKKNTDYPLRWLLIVGVVFLWISCSDSKNTEDLFTPNKTSAKLLADVAKKKMELENPELTVEGLERYTLVYDLYIKARTYAILNKIAFILSVFLGVSVLVWPAVSVISKQMGFDWELFKSAVIQTTITALAALSFAVYTHYKNNQMHVENLMRSAVFSQESLGELKVRVIEEMGRIDTGFNFSGSVGLNPSTPATSPSEAALEN